MAHDVASVGSFLAVRPSRRPVSSISRIALREPLNGTASQSGESRIKIIASSPNQQDLIVDKIADDKRRDVSGCSRFMQNKTQQSPTPTP